MPIRFRCAYCNQLMAISRRKEGTVVRCPKCAGDIVVPSLEGTPAAHDEAFDDPAPGDNGAFAEPNVADALDFAATVKAPAEHAPKTTSPPPPPSTDLKRRGLFIPLGKLLLLIGVAVLLLILTFVAGLILGRSV